MNKFPDIGMFNGYTARTKSSMRIRFVDTLDERDYTI